MIQLKHVWKEVNLGKEKLAILEDITVHIKEGEFVAVIGPSGSGKSTVMHMLGLLDKPTQGTIFFQGKNVTEMSDDEVSLLRNKSVGFVFQQFNLVNKLSVLENILLPTLYAKNSDTVKALALAKNLAHRFGIEHRLTSTPNKISGGEQQRVAIARALIMDPDILLADEPTGNLDSKSGKTILTLLKELHVRDKKTIVLVTHAPDIARLAQRRITIVDGKISG